MAVIVVGGGIGGLSLALALARRGLRSTVLEQAPVIEAVGAGVQLGPNATRVLRGWGFEKAFVNQWVSPRRAEVRDARSGRLLIANRLGTAADRRWKAPYRVLTRSVLQTALLEAVRASGLVDLRLGASVVSVRSESDRAVALLRDRGEVTGEALFGCDGLHSVVRTAIGASAKPRLTGQTAWRGLAHMPTPGDPLVQVWTGPRRHFVRYPVAEGVVNMVAVVEAKAAEPESWSREGQGADLAAAFADWPETVRATIAAVDRPWRSALYDRPPLARWTSGRIALLGDAAHPMLPFLAQGAAMAIEDAEVAAGLLSQGGDVGAALLAYQQARLTRTAKVQAWSRRNATLFHLPSPLAAGVFGAAALVDKVRDRDPGARFDWLYGWAA